MRNKEPRYQGITLRGMLAVAFVFCLTPMLVVGCAKSGEGSTQETQEAQEAQDTLKVSQLQCIHETEFGGVYLDTTADEFNKQGFEYGDSITISFSNGYELEDIPYYNGYYSGFKEPLLVAYPGYPHIRAGFNNGDDLWEVAKLDEQCTADITLFQAGKYAHIQAARDIHYEDDRSLFESDEQFANFRCVEVGHLKKGQLYRSASPCDNQHNRAPYVDALMEKAHVNYVVNLADNVEAIEEYMKEDSFASSYFASLYEKGNVVAVAQGANYESEDFRKKTKTALVAMAENDGPYLVHCTEGKDRTGFALLLIDAFSGASYEEIEADYMLTYDNYYGINKQSDPEKYKLIVENVMVPMVQIIANDTTNNVEHLDLQKAAEAYLLDIGMSPDHIEKLRQKLLTE